MKCRAYTRKGKKCLSYVSIDGLCVAHFKKRMKEGDYKKPTIKG